MVVSDISAACAELVERGVDVGEVQVFPWRSEAQLALCYRVLVTTYASK